MAAKESPSSNELQAEAFKQLYPEQYYAKFINSDIRPDGRALGAARAATIGINPIGTADSSALVKIGETTAMAGVKLGVCLPLLLSCNLTQQPYLLQYEVNGLRHRDMCLATNALNHAHLPDFCGRSCRYLLWKVSLQSRAWWQ